MSLIGHSGARCDTRRRFAVVAVAVLAMLLLVEPFVAPAVAGGKGSSGDRSANADGRGKGKSEKGKSEKGKSEKGKSDNGKSDNGKGKGKGKDDDKDKSGKNKNDRARSDKDRSDKDKDKDKDDRDDKNDKDRSGDDRSENKGKSGKGKSGKDKDKSRADRDDGAQGDAAAGDAPPPPAGGEAPAPPPGDAGGAPDPDPPVSGHGSSAGRVGVDDQGRTEVANLDVRRVERLALQTPTAPPGASSPGAGVTTGNAVAGSPGLTGPRVAARAVLASPPLPLLIRPRPHVQAGVIESSREVAVEVGRDLTEHPEFPLVLMLAAGLFLLLQHRLDRNDPKLAAAPAHQSVLEFYPLPEDSDS